MSFFFALWSGGTGLRTFSHLTAEGNSAYGNSPLRFKLARDSARPPEGGTIVLRCSQRMVRKDAVFSDHSFY